LRISGGQ